MELLIIFIIGCVICYISELTSASRDKDNTIARLKADYNDLSRNLREALDDCETISDLEDEIEALENEAAEKREIIDNLINEPQKTYPWIARAYADYITAKNKKFANPALHDVYSDRGCIRALMDENAELAEELKNTQYTLDYITHASDIKQYDEALAAKKKEIAVQIAEFDRRIRRVRAIKESLDSDINAAFPYLASFIANAEEADALQTSIYLENKKNKAEKTAKEIREQLSKKIKEYSQRAVAAEAKLAYYEATVPVLEELSEGPAVRVHTGDEDQTRNWLTREEYERLTPAERNQRALDNYKASHNKSKRQIGRDYERYVGWLYESKGYSVEYKGILAGLEDLGRDLICRKDGRTVIIQCKYWSKDKLIHEKHINQLFGTYMHYMIEMHKDGAQNGLFDVFDLARDSGCSACFWTKTALSDTARAFADALGIEVHEHEEIGDYPMIKCNINRMTGEKIYHLPFDINYDKTIIDPAHGEFYAATVLQAESAGFRRTHKWTGM